MKASAFKHSHFWVSVIAATCLCCSSHKALHQSSDSTSNSSLANSDMTDSLLLPECGNSGQLVKHYAYALCYSEAHEQASWVAYRLTREHLNNTITDRIGSFKIDPLITTGSACHNDYARSGYDKGHLANAADFRWSEQAERESFYMSNMSPQLPQFNRGGAWRKLEDKVRDWAIQESEIYVVTGGVLTDGLQKIGQNGISIPQSFYKVILDISHLKMIGFLLPTESSKDSLSKYAISVDSIEKVTTIDFFPNLPDSLENTLEKECDWNSWR